MPVTDFRITIGFSTHPKIKELERRRGDRGVLALIKLWEFTALHYTDGVLPNMSESDLARHLGRGSHFTKLIDDLLALRLLDRIEGGFQVHDWDEHQGWVAKARKRSRNASASAKARWTGSAKESGTSEGGVTEDCATATSSPAVLDQSSEAKPAENKEPADAPIPTYPYPTFPTSEGSQQEKSSGDIDDRWRAVLAWFKALVPPRCLHVARPLYMNKVVERLVHDGIAVADLPASAADDIVAVFVPRSTVRSKQVASIVRQEWEQALAAVSPVPESSDERASADDFMAELKRDPSLLVRNRESGETATGGVQ